jgi:deazaflavin-dependent oxidoreductase (nitroreductase family)
MEEPYGRIGRRRWAGALTTASLLLLMLCWVDWWYGGSAWFGVPYPWYVTAALLVNVAVTARCPAFKRTIVAGFQRWMLNPLVRLLHKVGLTLGWSLLETTGRRTGQQRVVPVGNGLVGSQFWIVAEHGLRAGYVRNLAGNQRVRVRVRDGWRLRWRTGIAHVLADDDPYARQRWLIGRSHPLRALNAMIVRVLGTEPVTIRIDLDEEAPEPAGSHRSALRPPDRATPLPRGASLGHTGSETPCDRGRAVAALGEDPPARAS